MPSNGNSAMVATLRDIASQFQPALNRLPVVVEVHKASRALGVLLRALEDLEGALK